VTDEERAGAQAWMARAHEAIASAAHSLTGGFHSDAVSRSYYAVFYAATALLTTRGIIANSHQAAMKLLSREFVKTGLLPGDYGRFLNVMFRERQDADYVDVPGTSAQQAEGLLERARDFVADASALLERIIGDV